MNIPFGRDVLEAHVRHDCNVAARLRKIHLDIETFTLDQAPEAYARLRRGEVRGRAVIVPSAAPR